MSKDKAMKLALDSLVYASSYCDTYDAITAIKQALAAPVQEPVQEPVVFYRCNGCGHAYEQVHPTSCDCMEAGGFDRVEYYTTPPAAQPAPVEPFEYWNAVEGWVKIDEVREHFDSVGCGTIYKTSGDGRVPLTAAQRQWVGLTPTERKQIEKRYVFVEDAIRLTEAKLKEKNT
jgi:hypothetical protein